MNTHYELIKHQLTNNPKRWLISGVAGFIGSNILEELLSLGQIVVGLDNFSTGKESNLDQVRELVGPKNWRNFIFIEGDICDRLVCMESCRGIDYILHQAALGSVPRSIENPLKTNEVNISGFLNMILAAKDNNVIQFVYAASSSTYGDLESLPKIEENIGKPLSPYAITKYVNELYADVFFKIYGIPSVGLRYFNVFGPRQDPKGAYAAVIPRWISSIIRQEDVFINGDGETSRDFTYVKNVVQANILGATSTLSSSNIFNIAVGGQTTLNQLYELLIGLISIDLKSLTQQKPIYRNFRTGDVLHSRACIEKAKNQLKYEPTHDINSGLSDSIRWYVKNLS